MAKNGLPSSLGLRFGFALPTMALIVVGSLYVARGGPPATRNDLDATFITLVGGAVLPAVIYLLGVRRHPTDLYGGVAILCVTLGGWIFVFTSKDAMRGGLTIPAFFVTLVIAVVSAVTRSDANHKE